MPVGVGYHSGSHFSALQALEKFLSPDEINLQFIGTPPERLQLLLDQKVDSANVFGAGYYVLEQQGFRKLLDTTFMIGFLINGNATDEDWRNTLARCNLPNVILMPNRSCTNITC